MRKCLMTGLALCVLGCGPNKDSSVPATIEPPPGKSTMKPHGAEAGTNTPAKGGRQADAKKLPG